jgi:hypothetical protein
MKKILSVLLAVFLLFGSFTVRADEGMWLLSLIGKNYDDMKTAGFKLSPEDIYNINQGCIKDAIVGLGREGSPFWHFCSGEIVSDQGLFLTNHHCGYGMIQSHSTVEHDYLRDGFWAYSKDQELTNEGITASILVRMEDVTDKINSQLNDNMSEEERNKKIQEISKELASAAAEGTEYDATVKSMFNNNQFFLFVHIIYKDVRLVGAPPSSMGKFGGDTDNWEWPRHTNDFSIFRIYTAPDGSPAKYSKGNIPLKPKHFLPVSNKGIKEGDYAMILGFPGSTDRYITSYGLEETMEITNKLRYEIRDVKINILRKEMASDQKIRIQYASKYASCSNYWKNSFEQNKALRRLNTMNVKKEIEAKYIQWAQNKDKKYAEALPLIQKAYENRAPYAVARMYLYEGLVGGPELPYFAYRASGLIDALKEKDQSKIDKISEKLKESAKSFYKDYNAETEKKIMKALFKYVYDNLDQQYYPDFFSTVEKKYKGDFDKYIDEIFAKSIFVSEEKLNSFLSKPNLKTLESDLAMQTGISIMKKYIDVNGELRSRSEGLTKGERLFVDGILQVNFNKNMYPDANSTIRLTYGTVKKYDPRDGVAYDYYTTIEGVMQKEDPNNSEFIVPEKLKELYAKKDYGPYINEKGELVTCFISDNDITGGNSGSPVINSQGHLIGIAFDGNSEAMSGDINFEENLQRCINVDIRYVLFTIDKYAGAKNLIEEMNIVY